MDPINGSPKETIMLHAAIPRRAPQLPDLPEEPLHQAIQRLVAAAVLGVATAALILYPILCCWR